MQILHFIYTPLCVAPRISNFLKLAGVYRVEYNMVMDFVCWLDQLLTQHNVHTANAAGALCKCNETAAAAHPFSLDCHTFT
jgi:hypothetical protein